jgi:hypothetical protein
VWRSRSGSDGFFQIHCICVYGDFILGGGWSCIVVCLDDVFGCKSISILPRTLTRTSILTLNVRDGRVVILDNRGGDLVGILCIGVLVDPFLVGNNVVKTDRCRARGYVSVSLLLKCFATNGETYARRPERCAGQPESLHNAPGWCCGWPLERCL